MDEVELERSDRDGESGGITGRFRGAIERGGGVDGSVLKRAVD